MKDETKLCGFTDTVQTFEQWLSEHVFHCQRLWEHLRHEDLYF